MSHLQRHIATVTDTSAYLVAQLHELEQLREQVRRALLSTKRAPLLKRRHEHGAYLHVSSPDTQDVSERHR